MPCLGRIEWLSRQIEGGRRAHLCISQAADATKLKYRFVLCPAGEGPASRVLRTQLLEQLVHLRGLLASHVVMDRGHRFSSGIAEIAFWLQPIRPGGAAALPGPPGPPDHRPDLPDDDDGGSDPGPMAVALHGFPLVHLIRGTKGTATHGPQASVRSITVVLFLWFLSFLRLLELWLLGSSSTSTFARIVLLFMGLVVFWDICLVRVCILLVRFLDSLPVLSLVSGKRCPKDRWKALHDRFPRLCIGAPVVPKDGVRISVHSPSSTFVLDGPWYVRRIGNGNKSGQTEISGTRCSDKQFGFGWVDNSAIVPEWCSDLSIKDVLSIAGREGSMDDGFQKLLEDEKTNLEPIVRECGFALLSCEAKWYFKKGDVFIRYSGYGTRDQHREISRRVTELVGVAANARVLGVHSVFARQCNSDLP